MGDAAESCFHLLVSSLGLSIRLGVKTGGETGRGTEMSVGMPCRRKMCLTRRSAVSLEDGSLGSAMKCAALEKRSITVRMLVFPSDVGRPVTKSRVMCDQGRLGMGRAAEVQNEYGSRFYSGRRRYTPK